MNEMLAVHDLQEQPPEDSLLACRLRAKDLCGREGPIPLMGEVELENCSAAPLEIQYVMTPLQYLELVVTDVNRKVVSVGHFADRFSPSLEAAVLRLLPGDTFTAPVALLATVPRERRLPGRYTVFASYRFRGVRVQAEPLTVEVTNAS